MKKLLFLVFLFIPAAMAWGQDPAPDAPLTVQKARRQVEISGYTRADTTVNLAAEVSGKVLAVSYDVGDKIGDKPFVQVDPTFVEFKIQNAKKSLLKLDAALKKNQSMETYLEKEFRRMEGLHKDGRMAEVRKDAAQNDWTQAQLNTDSLMADKGALQVQIAELTENKKRHGVRAPRGWTVVARNVEPGEIINPGVPLARVADFSRLVVPLCLSRMEMETLESLGATFDVTLDGQPAKAALDWVNPEFDERTRKRCIQLKVVEHSQKPRGGMEMKLALDVTDQGLMIPLEALVSRYENPRVFPKDSEQPVSVLVLGRSNGHAIISPNARLQPGMVLLPAEK